MGKDAVILAVESSCDETSASLVRNGREVLSNIISSQISVHKKFGGVVPEVASRKHIENISQVIDLALDEAGLKLDDIDGIAVTYGPGLVGALLIGLTTAKALAYARKLPLIGVNHIEGHIYANFIQHKELEPPFVCLVASGGHSHIVNVRSYGKYEIMGMTRDDAAGEAFDKIARALGLGYPGGPLVDKIAREGNPHAIDFPRAYLEEGSYDFSFSGLKSAVLNFLNSLSMKGSSPDIPDVAASFQQAVVDVLSDKLIAAAEEKKSPYAVLAGGVAANSKLREELSNKGLEKGIKVLYPDPILCTDNAAMIGSAGYYKLLRGEISEMNLNAVPNLTL
ncbi:tRNA (adenosine(37)-N6)-threonylcarbamoyltransferase complex transferase subunit TsaD [Lutispora saccharofermentans]|uniref:tRNA N6-adenosine threonylcarbamoyltransferase n=1 Tax=Lutispora saccharofermentans TaxID=3024236 RepID=A0ABT1NBM5_9FIRM|nr:tRNA (adenosine(37)-N6)-threonylcarbamoyltransferase complex transferase subunit TsaD [Lutispora saccharofermentans]MCQ1528662.1 tRNA (adenosine(37)-N6)-threonylcarbamoyltransferase complex transferase subunit TsaD [Lutispora saccharofermentans]